MKITLKNELEREIEKWSRNLDKKLPKIKPKDEPGEKILENAQAYRKDSEHFFEDDELIKSFEALIWAWAFIEIGENFNHLSNVNSD